MGLNVLSLRDILGFRPAFLGQRNERLEFRHFERRFLGCLHCQIFGALCLLGAALVEHRLDLALEVVALFEEVAHSVIRFETETSRVQRFAAVLLSFEAFRHESSVVRRRYGLA